MNGRMIVCEGIDGCGKSTLVKGIAKDLINKGYSVKVMDSRNVHNSIVGSATRAYSDAGDEVASHTQITLLYLAALEGVAKGCEAFDGITKLKERYDYIIMDRWYYSTYIYGSNTTEDTNAKIFENRRIETIIDTVLLDVPVPDITLYLSISGKQATSRLMDRDGLLTPDFFSSEEKLEAYAKKYDAMCKRLPEMYAIDATADRDTLLREAICKITADTIVSGVVDDYESNTIVEGS